MQSHQQSYRVLVIIFTFLLVLNTLIVFLCLVASAWSHTPMLMWYLIGLWLISAITFSIFKKKSVPINYKKGVITLLIVVFFSLLPMVSFFVMGSLMRYYIPKWEAKHCIKYDHEISLNLNAKCDNGDSIFIYEDPSDMRRLFEGGIKNSHYPYSLFY
ncbi:MAG: hypothetical protein NTV72_00440 [Candidatus Taylorbacteria bacterium]|nr:hypothetical protein [Candidatus Taylorbacteria bacterium]